MNIQNNLSYYIDATNEFIGGGGGGNGGNIIIAGGSGSNLNDYIYTKDFNNHTQLYLNNSNFYGEIRFRNLNIAGNVRDHEAKIDIFGKLAVFHPYNILNPLYTEGWKDVENELN